MRVKVIEHFGNHAPGEICDSIHVLPNGRKLDSETDRKAFATWIENGWAVPADAKSAPKLAPKRRGRPPKNKSRASAAEK